VSGGARIALVTAQTAGGIGRHVASIVPELVNRGARVEVYGPPSTRDFGSERAGAVFVPLGIPDAGSSVGRGGAVLRLARRLRGADLVHAQGIRAGLVAGLAARMAGVRHVIVTVHNAVEGRGDASGAAERALAALAERRLYVSDDIAERGRAAAPSKAGSVVVMPVGAEAWHPASRPADMSRVTQAIGAPDGTPVVLAVGRLARQKGFDVLVEAASLVDGDAAVAIVGEGPERSALEDRIRRLGLEKRVGLLGFRADARALTAAADVVCMPSRWEGSPLALHEALAAGRPVVASAVGGIPALAGEGAILVPPEDPRALASALDAVLGDARLQDRLSAAAVVAAATWPDAAATARRIADLYEEVLGRPLSGSVAAPISGPSRP
jgi:glycosyltransferase involved in cell wall biosynthesis